MKKIGLLLLMVSGYIYSMEIDQQASTAQAKFEIAELYKAISPDEAVYWNDQDVLYFRFEKAESLGKNFTPGNWQGYCAYCDVFPDATQQGEPYLQVKAIYKTPERAQRFVKAMNALLDSKNIPSNTRKCAAKEGLTNNPEYHCNEQ